MKEGDCSGIHWGHLYAKAKSPSIERYEPAPALDSILTKSNAARIAGGTMALGGLTISATAYVRDHFYGIDETMNLSYGQIWNLAHMCLTSIGAGLFAFGVIGSGINRGRERYKKEIGVAVEREKTPRYAEA